MTKRELILLAHLFKWRLEYSDGELGTNEETTQFAADQLPFEVSPEVVQAALKMALYLFE